MKGKEYPRSGDEILKRPIVYVTALDHYTDEWALGVREEREPMFISVVGWLVGEDDHYIYVASKVTENAAPDLCNVYAILKNTIVDMWELKKVQGSEKKQQ